MNSVAVKLSDFSYYKTGGSCDHFYQPSSIEEAVAAIQEINAQNSPYFLLGAGSNSLVWDEYFHGSVISFSNLNKISISGTNVHCQAGVSNTALAEFCFNESLVGAGWMNRLPGQVGGTVRMNARCYGGEISQIAEIIHVVTEVGQVRTVSAAKSFRGYKDTVFMNSNDLIVAVDFSLSKGTSSELEATRKLMINCEKDRVDKGQFLFPSCGCIFKNDYTVGVPSGLLLQHSGAKGLVVGGAEVSDGHSNFVYNKQATSHDILQLTFQMQDLVWEKFGVWLAYEMEVLGTLPDSLHDRYNLTRPHELKASALQPLLDSQSST